MGCHKCRSRVKAVQKAAARAHSEHRFQHLPSRKDVVNQCLEFAARAVVVRMNKTHPPPLPWELNCTGILCMTVFSTSYSVIYRSARENLQLCLSELIPLYTPSSSLRLANESFLDVPGPRDCITKRYGRQAFRYDAFPVECPTVEHQGNTLFVFQGLLSWRTSFFAGRHSPSHFSL